MKTRADKREKKTFSSLSHFQILCDSFILFFSFTLEENVQVFLCEFKKVCWRKFNEMKKFSWKVGLACTFIFRQILSQEKSWCVSGKTIFHVCVFNKKKYYQQFATLKDIKTGWSQKKHTHRYMETLTTSTNSPSPSLF